MHLNFSFEPFAILGAGKWGTAIAIHLGRQKQNIRLWGRSFKLMQKMQTTRINENYLPGYQLASSIRCVSNLEETLQDTKDILIAVPSHQFQCLLDQLKPYARPSLRLIWVTKGLDPKTHSLLPMLVEQQFPHISYAILTGPSFAEEVVQMLPTVVHIASKDNTFLESLQNRFDTDFFKTLLNNDVIGASVSGSFKNIIAIIAGILDGLGFGNNIQAVLITYALHEMQQLINTLGGTYATSTKVAGISDLILTCTNQQSRNRLLGIMIGKTLKIPTDNTFNVLSEGLLNTQSIYLLSQKHALNLPICRTSYSILFEKTPVKEAIHELLQHLYRKDIPY